MVSSINYLNRQAVRERIAAKTERALVFDIESAVLTEESYLITAQAIRTLSANQAIGGILYQDGNSFVVTAIDSANATITASTVGGVMPVAGRAELWRNPGSVDATNQIIDGTIDRIIQRGYRASANFEDWVYSRGSGVVRIPDYVQSINSVEVYDDTSRFTSAPIMSTDISVVSTSSKFIEGSDYQVYGTGIEAGDDLVNFRVQTPVSNERLFNVVLVNLLSASDMKVKISDGDTETEVVLYANTWRTVGIKSARGFGETTNFMVSSSDSALEYNLYIGQVVMYLNESGRKWKQLRNRFDWDIDRANRTIQLYSAGATRVRVRAYRFPQEVVNDTDIVEVPPNALVEYAASQILLAGLPPRGQDTSGISSQFPYTANRGEIDLIQVPVPAISYLVGATSRTVSVDIWVSNVQDSFTVGFIVNRDDAHLVDGRGVLNDTLSVSLPSEARYLSIEWEEEDVVSAIEIDGYDQMDAFDVEGNRAVSRAPLRIRPDATTIDIRLVS